MQTTLNEGKNWAKQLLNKYMWEKNQHSFPSKNPEVTEDGDLESKLLLEPECVSFILRICVTVLLHWTWKSPWHLSLHFSPSLGGADRKQRLWLCPPRGPRGDGRAAGHEAPAWAGPPLTGCRWGRSQFSIFLLSVRDPWTRWELQTQYVCNWWLVGRTFAEWVCSRYPCVETINRAKGI